MITSWVIDLWPWVEEIHWSINIDYIYLLEMCKLYPESKLLYEEFLEFHSQTSPCMTKKLWIETIKKSSIQSLNNWSCHIFRECKFNHQSNRLLGKLASECEVSRVIVYCFSCNGDLVWGTESSCCFLSEWGHRESCSRPINSHIIYFLQDWNYHLVTSLRLLKRNKIQQAPHSYLLNELCSGVKTR